MIPQALVAVFAVLGLATCGSRTVALVQQSHGREMRCDRRFVAVEHVEDERWVSRGCGFEAQWACRERECVLRDMRAWGVDAP